MTYIGNAPNVFHFYRASCVLDVRTQLLDLYITI